MTVPSRLSVPGLAVVVAVVASGTLALSAGTDAALPGLSVTGAGVRWGLPAAQGVHDFAAAVTVGCLVVAATVVPGRAGAGRALTTVQSRLVQVAAAAAAVWALCGVAVLVLTYVELSGSTPPVGDVVAQLGLFVTDFELGRGLAVSTAGAFVVGAGCAAATRVSTVGWLAAGAVAALLPLALVGHAASAVDHDVAVTALAAHLVGAAVWVGGLVALLLVHRRLDVDLAVSVQRYSTIAGAAYVLVLGSGVLGGVLRIDGWGQFTTAYGALLLVKLGAGVALGVIGWWHRRRHVAALASTVSSRGSFLRWAGGELLLMAVTIGVAVALSRTPPPPRTGSHVSLTTELLGYAMPGPLTAAGWVTQWRIDPVWVPLAVLAVAAYVVGVRRLRRRGDRWPVGRTVLWVLGWVLLVWATSSGPGVYGRVLFSMHMVQHMTLAMVVPVLLVLAAPLTLALRTLPARADGSRGPREWLLAIAHSRALQLLAHPAVAGAIFTGSFVVFYMSPLFDLALRTHTGHVLMTVHFLAAGYLFAWVICGPDPGPRRPPHLLRMILLFTVMGFHAFFGVSIMGSTRLIGEQWFTGLDRSWGSSLVEDQQTGGAIGWALGELPVVVLVLALAAAWIRADRREADRLDRRGDRDGDAELAAYNARLQGLANPTERQPQ